MPATGSGRLQGVWDGRDAEGKPVTVGQQTVEVLQYRDKKLLIHTPAITESKVTEIRMEPAGTTLVLANGGRLALADIQAIKAGD